MVILGVIIGIICIILSIGYVLLACAAGAFVSLLPQSISPEDLATAIDYEDPETMECVFGPIVDKLEHVNIFMLIKYVKNYENNKATAYDFSKFEEDRNRIIYGTVNTPNKDQDGEIVFMKDVTFYRFEDGVCCWV